MTITTTGTVERYVGDGSQTVWPITFPFFKGEDVKACIVNNSGEQVNLVYGTDYTVTKSSYSIGGTLNYALNDGLALTIWLNLPITQQTDFYNTGPLNAETLEGAFDRLTLIAQQLQEASGRSVKVETSSTKTPEELLVTLYAGRDVAVASASAAASSESNAAASEQAAASSESAAAGSAISAEAWAESEAAPDPDDAESKSAKTWALIASDNVPIATASLAGKAKTSDTWQVDPETGVATVPTATEAQALVGEDDTTFMTPLGVKTVIDACRADDDDIMDGTSTTKFLSVIQSPRLDLSNINDEGKAHAVGWGMPSNVYIDIQKSGDEMSEFTAPSYGYVTTSVSPTNQICGYNCTNNTAGVAVNLGRAPSVTTPLQGWVPASPGDVCTSSTNNGAGLSMARFYYAQGFQPASVEE